MISLTREEFAADRGDRLEEFDDELRPVVADALVLYPTEGWETEIVDAAAVLWLETYEAAGGDEPDPVMDEWRSELAEALARTSPPDDPPSDEQIDRITYWVTTDAANGGTVAAADTTRADLEWLTRNDEDVRDTHRAVHGQTRAPGRAFNVGGYELFYPGQPVGPPEIWLNCRCLLRVPNATALSRVQEWTSEDSTSSSKSMSKPTVTSGPGSSPSRGTASSTPQPHQRGTRIGSPGSLPTGDSRSTPSTTSATTLGPARGEPPAHTGDASTSSISGISRSRDNPPTPGTTGGTRMSAPRGTRMTSPTPGGGSAGTGRASGYAEHVFEKIHGVDGDRRKRSTPDHAEARSPATGAASTMNARKGRVMGTTTPTPRDVFDTDAEAPPEVTEPDEPMPWHGVLAPEGVPTGDKRMFAIDALTHRDLPLPLRYVPVDSGQHNGAVIVGNIQRIWREGNLVKGEGAFHDGKYANEAVDLIAQRMLRGVSVDLDDIEVSFAEDEGEEDVVTSGRISAATLVAIPAFAEAYVTLGSEAEAQADMEQLAADGECLPCQEKGEFVSDKPWSDFTQSDYTDEQWFEATCLHRNGNSRVKSDNGLPIREPSGTLNRNGVHAAASRFNQTEGPSDAMAAAASCIRGAYNEMNEEPPEAIAASILSESPELTYAESVEVGDSVTWQTTDDEGEIEEHAGTVTAVSGDMATVEEGDDLFEVAVVDLTVVDALPQDGDEAPPFPPESAAAAEGQFAPGTRDGLVGTLLTWNVLSTGANVAQRSAVGAASTTADGSDTATPSTKGVVTGRLIYSTTDPMTTNAGTGRDTLMAPATAESRSASASAHPHTASSTNAGSDPSRTDSSSTTSAATAAAATHGTSKSSTTPRTSPAAKRTTGDGRYAAEGSTTSPILTPGTSGLSMEFSDGPVVPVTWMDAARGLVRLSDGTVLESKAAQRIGRSFVDQTHDGPGWITNPEDSQRLRNYWTRGAGAAKIRWGAPGDFNRCRRQLAKYIQNPQWLAGTCANLHRVATGTWPGEHAAENENLAAAAPPFTLVASAAAVEEAPADPSSLSAPLAWFEDPKLDGPTAAQFVDEGPLTRIYGHMAAWDTCHTGIDKICRTPPHSQTGYAYFATGVYLTAEGETVPVGTLTLDTGHAPGELASGPAIAHYDNTGSVAAYVAVGEDDHGIWFSGIVAPWLDEGSKTRLRGATLSGDWRTMRGSLELVAALAVNVPGFPIPRTSITASAGTQKSLVAAGILTPVLEDTTTGRISDKLSIDEVADALFDKFRQREIQRKKVEQAMSVFSTIRTEKVKAARELLMEGSK